MNTRELPAQAARRLQDAPAAKRIVLIYAGISTGLAVLTSLVSYLLGLQIDKTGGLGGMGTRSILSALQSMLPLIQSAVLMCLTLGYRAAMLRVARGQYTSPNTLRLGFDRFWLLLRCSLIQGMILLTVGIACVYSTILILMMTPLAGPVMEVLSPIVSSMTALNQVPVLEDAVMLQLMDAMTPMLCIAGAVYLLAAVPIMLRYRMTDYVVIDKPGIGALTALRESRMMMRGSCKKLLALDFRLWWYYAALAGATILGYGDLLLPIFGIRLPMSAMTASYAFYALYLGVQFAIDYYLCNRIEVIYSLAYESVRPREETGGAVLGNIFQM